MAQRSAPCGHAITRTATPAGFYSKYQLEARAIELQAEHAKIKAERVELERRVQLMHDGTLEKDMLDEQARRALNLSHADEITILLDRPQAN
jgi:cell division protein FtsB